MEEIDKINSEIEQLVQQLENRRKDAIKQKLEYLSKSPDNEGAHLTEEEWSILREYLTAHGEATSVKMQRSWYDDIDGYDTKDYEAIIRIGNKYISIHSGMEQGYPVYEFNVSDTLQAEVDQERGNVTLNGITFVKEYSDGWKGVESIVSGKKELTQGLDIEHLFEQVHEQEIGEEDYEYDDNYEYDNDDDDYGYDDYYDNTPDDEEVIYEILRNRIVDTAANAMFGESYNFCEIGQYDDMPGEEAIAETLNSMSRETLKKYFEENPEDLALFEQMRAKYDDILSLDGELEKSKSPRQKFEESLLRPDMVEYYLSKTSEELESELGEEVARMVGFEQKNSHHCYDLWEHSLRTVEGIKPDGLTPEQFRKLRVAAFFHDIGKPDVAKFNDKTGQQVFYGHAMHSVEVAGPILAKLGYSKEEIEQLGFYIGHHDDFISYKTQLAPFMKNHEFIRGITPETISEKMFENKYDFEKMGYDKDQIRAICYTLANGRKPDFRTKDGPIEIPLDMEDVKAKICSQKYNAGYDATLEDYQMLLQLCKADAGAQSEIAMQNGRQVGSKAEKLENMGNIEGAVPQAYKQTTQILTKMPQSLRKAIEEYTGYSLEDFVSDTKNGFKRPMVVMGDGVSMAVQASAFHYCEPKKSGLDSYKSYEVGCPSEVIEQLREYVECPVETDEEFLNSIYPFVPADVLSQIVMEHGGIDKEATLHPEKKLAGYKQEKAGMEDKNKKAQDMINQFIAQIGNVLEDYGKDDN